MTATTNLLWSVHAADVDGTLALRVTDEGDDEHTGIAVQLENGALIGLQLNRSDLQELRNVLGSRLIDLS